MGSKVQILGGHIQLAAVPNANGVSNPAGTLELHCTNGSNLAFTFSIVGYQSTGLTVATAAFTSANPGPITKTINAQGRSGVLNKIPPVVTPVGQWNAVGIGNCNLIARTDVSGPSGLLKMYSILETVTVQ